MTKEENTSFEQITKNIFEIVIGIIGLILIAPFALFVLGVLYLGAWLRIIDYPDD